MRTLLLACLCSAALLQPVHGEERRLSSATLQDYVGQYKLADGRNLSVTQRNHQLLAKVDGRAPAMLQPDGAATFVTRSRDLQLTFDQRANGNVTGVTLTIMND